MPNPWTGKGNPYTREEIRERLQETIDKKKSNYRCWSRYRY